MAMDDNKRTSEAIYAAPIANMVDLTVGINQIAAGDRSVNGYALRKAIVHERKKREILYKNGVTLPVTVQALFAEAEPRHGHSRKLGRNIQRGNSDTPRPKEVDAHHIVAWGAQDAPMSRVHLFKVGLGVNDVDNGCYFPRYRATKIMGMPNAPWHQAIHTVKYHANVYAALRLAPEHTQTETRKTLRSIKSQLIAGIFPY